MLYWLAAKLSEYWGPFRLLSSHLMLMAAGTLLGGLIVWSRLPKLWRLLPHDGGKALAADGGMAAKGKPTGAGMIFSLLAVPVIVLMVPLEPWMSLVIFALYLCMLFGFLDDSSKVPWGELRKGLLDAVVALIAAYCIYRSQGGGMWFPLTKSVVVVPLYIYLPLASFVLWFTMNAINCSDGVDGLAGSLTLFSLFALAALLYGVVGYKPVADYLLIPHNADGARWAILVATMAGALAGYLWHNAEPSRVLMGDAGSRLLGMLVGVSVLVAGNPVLVVVVAPMLLLNGGTGLFKLGLLRILRYVGFDVRQTAKLSQEDAQHQFVLVRALHKVRFPLHDHCRRQMGWSNPQVLVRFTLIQAFLTPLLFVIIVKVR